MITGLAVLVVGLAAVWQGMFPLARDTACPPYVVEGSSRRYEPSLRPPGGRTCVVTLPNGTRLEETEMPWRDWLLVAFLAAAAAVATAAGSARTWTQRTQLVAIACILGLVGLVTWFLSTGEALPVMAGTLALAIMSLRLVVRRTPAGPG